MHDIETEPPWRNGLVPEKVTGQVTATVGQADTAQALGSGDVPVLGTPRVLALAEAATVSALTRRIPTEYSSVGVEATVRHVTAVPLGGAVVAAVVLRGRDGDRLDFGFTVTDAESRLVAEGSIVRRLVNRDGFLARLRPD